MPYDTRKTDARRLAAQRRQAAQATPAPRPAQCCQPYPLASWRNGVLISVVQLHRGKYCIGTPPLDVLARYR